MAHEFEELVLAELQVLRAMAVRLEQKVIAIEQELKRELRRITQFRITQRGHHKMAVKGIQAGSVGSFAATPLDQSGQPGKLPAGVVPSWLVSDPNNAHIQNVSPDGLSTDVAVSPSAQISSFDLVVSATMPDGSVASGTISVPVSQPQPTQNIVAFQIDQTA